MKIYKLTPIDWLTAMDKLSIGAFFLLNVMYRRDIDMNDNTLMNSTGLGVSTHRMHKKELINSGYLLIDQVGRGKFKYTLKEYNG